MNFENANIKMNLGCFQMQKWVSQIVKARKADQKMGHGFHVSFLSYGP